MSDGEEIVCQDCGAEAAIGEERCESCQDNYGVCYSCANERLIEEGAECNNNFYCQECANTYLRECCACGCLYERRNRYSWSGMCPDCAREHFTCDNCGETLHNDYYGGEGLCNDCLGSEEASCSEYVHTYHHLSTSYIFHPLGETLYFGVELETDNYDNISLAAEDLHALSKDENLFFMEEDGSLSKGIEIISQPCSLDYHKHYFPWNEIVSTVRKHGGKSHDTTTCGLHIHFSRKTFEGQRDKLYQIRLVYLFEKFWRELVKFSRREGSWEYTARKYNIPIYDKSADEKMREIKNNFYRYQAVNLTNSETIEVRIFRGSLKVSTILASLELVDFLIQLVKKASNKELQTTTWAEVVERARNSKYEYLYPYLKDIGLAEGGQDVLDSSEA